MSVTEAANILDIHKSSASRMLSTMQKQGFVAINSNRKYEIGQMIFVMANTSTERMNIKKTAEPFLKKLNQETDETIHLSVLDGVNITYIDKLDSSKLIRMHSTVGASNPAYCTGVGKVLLAYLNTNEMNKAVNSIQYDKFTEATITDSRKMKKELQEIRKRGLAFDFGEHDEHINCIAAPVFNHEDKAIASVSISAPALYTSKEALLEYKTLLLQTVKAISEKFGYMGSIPPGTSQMDN